MYKQDHSVTMHQKGMHELGKVFVCDFAAWDASVSRLLEAVDLVASINVASSNTILIKPNLVEALDPPITTPVGLVAAIVTYLQSCLPDRQIIVAEGSGARDYDTGHSFESLGYTDMAREKGIELVDLNEAPLVGLSNPDCRRWPEMHLPEMVFQSYCISVPVLKAHSLAEVTLTMKNMMGIAPPSHYQKGGHWKKASFHQHIQEAIMDLNRYRTPDFTVLDATVGMQEAHLWGPTCNPPPNKLVASYDPVAVDAYGTGLLRRDWQKVGHLQMAHKELGLAEPLNVLSV